MRNILILFCFLNVVLFAQEGDMLLLDNPSFEGVAEANASPEGWYDCGFEGEFVHIIYAGYSTSAGIKQRAAVGKTYIGLVVRDNQTWEGIGQSLTKPLEVGACYEFHLRLSQSKQFFARDRFGERQAHHSPAKIKIIGGNAACEGIELLAETEVVDHYQWRDYAFVLSPQASEMTHLKIESYYLGDSLLPYNGHVLIDHASFLIKVDCAEKWAIEDQEKSYLPPNWYLNAMNPDERLDLAKKAWKSKLVSNTYSEIADPYKHKLRLQLKADDQVDEAIRKFTDAIEVPADLSKDGFVITLVSASLKEKKYTYKLLQDALLEIGIPWTQYRIYSEIESKRKYRNRSGKQYTFQFKWAAKNSLENIIIQIEEKLETKGANPRKDGFTLEIKSPPRSKKLIRKRAKKAMKVLDILPSQYRLRFK
ncbi:MAG: hypothetical protein AAF849_04070 [Bacteroidota bacterium]